MELSVSVRKQTLQVLAEYNISIMSGLPLIEELPTKSEEQVCKRALALQAVLSYRFGLSKKLFLQWIKQESLHSSLTIEEKSFINDEVDPAMFDYKAEAFYMLVWYLGKIEDVGFISECPDTIVQTCPDLKKMESSSSFINTIKIRNADELLAQVDLYYCLHWYCRSKQLSGESMGVVNPHVIIERRQALEWIADVDFDWDQGSLDT